MGPENFQLDEIILISLSPTLDPQLKTKKEIPNENIIRRKKLFGSSRHVLPRTVRKEIKYRCKISATGCFRSKNTAVDLQISVKSLHQTELAGRCLRFWKNDENQEVSDQLKAHRGVFFSGDGSYAVSCRVQRSKPTNYRRTTPLWIHVLHCMTVNPPSLLAGESQVFLVSHLSQICANATEGIALHILGK